MDSHQRAQRAIDRAAIAQGRRQTDTARLQSNRRDHSGPIKIDKHLTVGYCTGMSLEQFNAIPNNPSDQQGQ
jgi:hypothetical protein